MSHQLSSILKKLDALKEELRVAELPLSEYKDVITATSNIHAQSKVLRSLQEALEVLQENSITDPVPYQRSTRLRQLISFIFTDTRPKPKQSTKLTKTRCQQLRLLDYNVLKLVALSYTAAEVFDLEQVEFDQLLGLAPDFLTRYHVTSLLARKDLYKAIRTSTISSKDPQHHRWHKEFVDGMSATSSPLWRNF
jgi:hypothetical protein